MYSPKTLPQSRQANLINLVGQKPDSSCRGCYHQLLFHFQFSDIIAHYMRKFFSNRDHKVIMELRSNQIERSVFPFHSWATDHSLFMNLIQKMIWKPLMPEFTAWRRKVCLQGLDLTVTPTLCWPPNFLLCKEVCGACAWIYLSWACGSLHHHLKWLPSNLNQMPIQKVQKNSCYWKKMDTVSLIGLEWELK